MGKRFSFLLQFPLLRLESKDLWTTLPSNLQPNYLQLACNFSKMFLIVTHQSRSTLSASVPWLKMTVTPTCCATERCKLTQCDVTAELNFGSDVDCVCITDLCLCYAVVAIHVHHHSTFLVSQSSLSYACWELPLLLRCRCRVCRTLSKVLPQSKQPS